MLPNHDSWGGEAVNAIGLLALCRKGSEKFGVGSLMSMDKVFNFNQLCTI